MPLDYPLEPLARRTGVSPLQRNLPVEERPRSQVATSELESGAENITLVERWIGKAKRLRNTLWPNYVFIHINKTAGSSIERALDLKFEHKTALEKRAQLGDLRWNRAFKFSFVRNPWDKVASHYYYRVRMNYTGLRDNPIPFGDWVHLAYEQRDPQYFDKHKMFMPQAEWLCDRDGRLLVDFVGRFERLAPDFAEICRILQISARLPHLKHSDNRDYRTLYDSSTRLVVSRVFACDIDMFGYEF